MGMALTFPIGYLKPAGAFSAHLSFTVMSNYRQESLKGEHGRLFMVDGLGANIGADVF